MPKITVDSVTEYARPFLPVPGTGETVDDLRIILTHETVKAIFEECATMAQDLPNSELPLREALLPTLGWTQAQDLLMPKSRQLFRHLKVELRVKGPNEI